MTTKKTHELSHQPCPFPQCGSSDAYSVRSDGVGYCHSCQQGHGPNSKLPLVVRVSETRGILSDIAKAYGIYTHFDSDRNEPLLHEYRYPSGGKKFRRLPKESFWVEGDTNSLFGSHLFTPDKCDFIVVTEGEIDAASSYQMTKYPSVGLPSASIGKKLADAVHTYLSQFKKIILAIESDTAGNQAAARLQAMFPGKVYRADLNQYKDANDYLTATDSGAAGAYREAIRSARKYTPDNVFAPQDFSRILSESEKSPFVPTNCKEFNDVLCGVVRGHVTLLTAPEGIGKTEILRWLEYTVLKSEDHLPIGVIRFEETKQTTLRGYACYELQSNVRSPFDTTPVAVINETLGNLVKDDRLYIFELGDTEDARSILESIAYLVTVCNCKYIFIDPINHLCSSTEEGGQTRLLDFLSVKLSDYARAHEVGIVMTAHTNDNGETRDSRMIGKTASIRIALERDKNAPTEELRNTTTLNVVKNRPFSRLGPAGKLFFDVGTFTIQPIEKEFEE